MTKVRLANGSDGQEKEEKRYAGRKRSINKHMIDKRKNNRWMHGQTVGWTHLRTRMWSSMDGGLARGLVVKEIATYQKYATGEHCIAH